MVVCLSRACLQCFTKDGDSKGDTLFQQAMDKAFTEIVNLPTGKFTMARLLSFYTDKVLSGKEKVEDHEMNAKLEEVARLFAYFQVSVFCLRRPRPPS